MSLPRAPRRPSRPPPGVNPGSPDTEVRPELKLYHVGVQHREVTAPLHPAQPSLLPRALTRPRRESCTTRPFPAGTTRQEWSTASPEGEEGRLQGSPLGLGPERGGTGPGVSAAFPGPVRPRAHPLYLALRLGLLPLQLGLEAAAGTRAS